MKQPGTIVPVQIASGTETYEWRNSGAECENLQTLCPGTIESLGFRSPFLAARRLFKALSIKAAFLPSYAPLPETGVWAAAQTLGVRSIMMNESHAGTERATGWKRWVKRRMIRRFDAALVGGAPQKRHFATLGIPEERIFTGYDAIDNAHFARAAAEARQDAQGVRHKLRLPDRYFLSLGRMVEKKNLGVLLESYASFVQESSEDVTLAMVGSGAEESGLRAQARALGLRVHEAGDLTDGDREELGRGDVVFYGFRQIDENPSFFALAEAFVLPSLWEEWGLVVNEAMTCGVPVLVSEAAGCAEDLVDDGVNGFTFDPRASDELARHLRVLAEDPPLRSSMGTRSEEIIAKWGCDHFADQALMALKAAERAESARHGGQR